MKQTKLVSLIEALINTAVGFAVSYAAWPIAAVISGITYTSGQHAVVVGFFTLLSVARGYVIRRFFNAGMHTAAVKLARKLTPNPPRRTP